MIRITIETGEDSERQDAGLILPSLALASILESILRISGVRSEVEELEEQSLYNLEFQAKNGGGRICARTFTETLAILNQYFGEEAAEKASDDIKNGLSQSDSYYGIGISWNISQCRDQRVEEKQETKLSKIQLFNVLRSSYPDQSEPIDTLAEYGDTLAGFLLGELASEDLTSSEAISRSEQAALDVFSVAEAIRLNSV